MAFMNISCKKATYLLSKKEEGKLSLLERWQLRSHLTICSICRLFEKQTSFIGAQAKHAHTDEPLREEVKQQIQHQLTQL